MNSPNVGIRENKKAKLKMKIVDTFLKALYQEELIDIKIMTLCDEIGISKVTFFNYFTSKEEVLKFYLSIWQYNLSYEIDHKNLKGTDIIYYIFNKIALAEGAQNLMIGIIHFYLKNSDYIAIKLTEYERYLCNQNAYENNIEMLSLRRQLEKALYDLDLKKSEIKDLVMILESEFYGIPLRNKIRNDMSLEVAYTKFLNVILKDYINKDTVK